MARPIAVGLKYFPFDVDLLDNEALDILREEYGMIVNSVYIGLLCFLYKKFGYFIPYETQKEKEECIWYIFKKVRGGKYSPSKETISQVIEACVARELFSRELYPKIITSKRAQAEFYSATVERKSVPICQEYWLLDVQDMEELSKKHPYYLEVTHQNYSDDKPNYSDDKLSKSDEKPLNKIKQNKTKLEENNSNLEERKKGNKASEVNFSKMTNEELMAWGERAPNFSADGLSLFEAYCYEMKSRCLEAPKWVGKIIKSNEGITRLQSHAEIMDDCGVKGPYRTALENFLRACYANGHLVTNDKLLGIIVALDMRYGKDGEQFKTAAIERAISGGYFDVKEKIL